MGTLVKREVLAIFVKGFPGLTRLRREEIILHQLHSLRVDYSSLTQLSPTRQVREICPQLPNIMAASARDINEKYVYLHQSSDS